MENKLDFSNEGFKMTEEDPKKVPEIANKIEKEYGKRAKNTFLKGAKLALASTINPYASGPYLDEEDDFLEKYKSHSK